MMFRYGPAKGQVRFAFDPDSLPWLLRSVCPSLGLTVFEGGEAVLSCRLARVDVLDAKEVAALAATPGVLREGDAWYFAARKGAGSEVFRGFGSVKEWEGYDPSREAGHYPEPCGSTTHWPAGRVPVWRFAV